MKRYHVPKMAVLRAIGEWPLMDPRAEVESVTDLHRFMGHDSAYRLALCRTLSAFSIVL